MKYTHIFAIIFLALFCNNAFAYQPSPPIEKTYESSNGNYRLIVKPGDEQNFFDNYGRGTKNSKQLDSSREKCIGILEKEVKSNYIQIWKKELDNDVSPASALVCNSGKYVVTFDNWHLEGQGDNVVVIYNEQGEIIKKLSLEDFVSRTETIRMTRTFPGWIIFWGKDHEIDERNELLILKLLIAPFPYTPWARGRNLEKIREQADEYEKWVQNNMTIRRIRLSDGFIIDKPLIDSRFEYPKFECERGRQVYQSAVTGRIWQFCILDNKQANNLNKITPDGKIQVSAFINGAWFKEVTGEYKNGKKHGIWTQIINEGESPCLREYNLDEIVKEECPQGWWGTLFFVY